MLLASVFSCNKSSEKSEQAACPLLYEMEKIEVNFELAGVMPESPELYIDQVEINSCDETNPKLCLVNIKTSDRMISFQLVGYNKLDENALIDLQDGGIIRVSRETESISRERVRPNDK